MKGWHRTHKAGGPCSVTECSREAKVRGYCGIHYQKVHDYGSPDGRARKPKNIGPCSVPGCGRMEPERGMFRGMCATHYQRMKIHGSVDTPLSVRRLACVVEGCAGWGNMRANHGMCRTHADIFRKHGTTERPPKRVPYTEEERKERARAAQRAYQSTPKGARYNRDKSREWYRSLSGEKLEAYRVKCHEWFKGWISKNRARNRERAKEYYRANKETILAKIGIYRRRYEERKRGRNLTLTDQEKADLVAFYKVSRSQKAIRCYWCGKRTKKTDRHLDHIVPISKGGPHLASNLCVACRDCNMTKHAQMPEQFSAQAVLL